MGTSLSQVVTRSRDIPAKQPSTPLQPEEQVEEDVGGSDFASAGSLSETSSMEAHRGVIANGRRFQTTRPGAYWGPADADHMEAGHRMYYELDSPSGTPLFRSPVDSKLGGVLDIGAGDGSWCVEVADRYPNAYVVGVDLYPPPQTGPLNCEFQVLDILTAWSPDEQWVLIHLRNGIGSFTPNEWQQLYRQAYDTLEPGGWFEQVESQCRVHSFNGTLPVDSNLAKWGDMLYRIGVTLDRPMDVFDTMKVGIESTGFVNVCEKCYRIPIGDWATNQSYKMAGWFNLKQLRMGMEGYNLHLLTSHGEPSPWSVEEVQLFVADITREIADTDCQLYIVAKRVWAQKPLSE